MKRLILEALFACIICIPVGYLPLLALDSHSHLLNEIAGTNQAQFSPMIELRVIFYIFPLPIAMTGKPYLHFYSLFCWGRNWGARMSRVHKALTHFWNPT